VRLRVVDVLTINSFNTVGLPFTMALKKNNTSYFDNHTTFITDLGPATKEQLGQALAHFFYQCEDVFEGTNREFWGRWRINIATNREGKSIGVAYVFFTKPEAYNVILGRNLDGTKRFKEEANPDYKEPEKDDFLSSFDFMNLDFKAPTMSWADMAEPLAVPKTIKTNINKPWVEFPKIRLTREQVAETSKTEVEPVVMPCKAYNPDPAFNKYILFCKNVPSWLSEGDIHALFTPYVTSPTDREKGFPEVKLVVQGSHGGRGKNNFFNKGNLGSSPSDGEWKVQKPKKEEKLKMAFVKFNSHGNDSMFALVMTKKVLVKGVGPNADKTVELFFSYAKDQGC